MNGMTLSEKLEALNQNSDVWEGGSVAALHGDVCLGRITNVNAETRTCTIKTYGSSQQTNNGIFYNVQWLALYSSNEGQEISFVPEINAQALILFEGTQPYIIGFFHPITSDVTVSVPDPELEGVEPKGASAAFNKERINPGDFILRTAGNCRIVMRRGGEIELEATKLCRRTYFPTRNLINELSQNYEFRTDGGTIDWVHPDPQSENTYFRQEWRDNVSRDNIIIDERGTIEADSNLIHRFQIGPTPEENADAPPPFEPVIIRETFNTGQTRFRVNNTLYDEEIKETGEYIKGVNGYLYYQNIKPTGEVIENVNNNFQHRILPSGEMFLDIGIEEAKEENIVPAGGNAKFKMNIKPSGDTTVEINEKIKMSMQASGQVVLDCGPGNSTITVDPSGAITLKTNNAVTCETNTVDLKASSVKLGKSVSDTVPMGKLFLAAVNKVIDVFNGHSHMYAKSKVGPVPTSPPMQPAQTIGEDVLSKTVEVQP
jgi:hypothetical protein